MGRARRCGSIPRWAEAAPGLLVPAALAGPLDGQVLKGVVRDVESGEPVALAYVGLLVPGRDLAAATLADETGRFTLRAPAEGSYFLHVSRHGYRSVVEGIFELGDDGMMEVAVGLDPTPVPLDSLRVGVPGDDAHLRAVGFYRRMRLGLGTFLEREDIERATVTHLTDALRSSPRLRVTTPTPQPGSPTGLLNPEVSVRQATGLCSPTLYVDGTVVTEGSRPDGRRSVRPDDFVDPGRVEAVEIYTSPAEVPVRYQSFGGCGVLLFWTRIGAP